MEEDVKILIRKNLELTKENNRLLKKIRRGMVISSIIRVLWLAIIVGVPVFLYYSVIVPYFREVAETYNTVQNGAQEIKEVVVKIPFLPEFFRNLISGTLVP